jgi:hypothetical protein
MSERLREERDRMTAAYRATNEAYRKEKRRADLEAAEADQLREALRESAERFHGLSDDPVHLAHIFAVCPSRECSEARAALEDTR